jgi:hypothetical protein
MPGSLSFNLGGCRRLFLICRFPAAMMETGSLETSLMRFALILSLSLPLIFTSFAAGRDEPRLTLMDEELSIQELRPLERHVWVLTLEGKWKTPAKPGVKHYVNVIFPNGGSSSHRVLSEEYAAKGEFRVLIQDPDLIRNQVPRGAKLTIVISVDKPVTSADAPEVISEPFVTPWPLDRPIVKRPVETRHTPPDELDAFPLPDDPLIKYKPKKKEMK